MCVWQGDGRELVGAHWSCEFYATQYPLILYWTQNTLVLDVILHFDELYESCLLDLSTCVHCPPTLWVYVQLCSLVHTELRESVMSLIGIQAITKDFTASQYSTLQAL